MRQPSGLAARGRPPPESSRLGARASSRLGARAGLSPSARGRLGRASSRRGARPRAGEVLFSVESSLVLCAPLGRTSPSGRFFRGRGPVCEGSDIRTQVYGINHQTVFYAPNIQWFRTLMRRVQKMSLSQRSFALLLLRESFRRHARAR